MSRPRKPFGATHPGRLPATMIKVLAAEMSDPQRLRRGKQYARDGSVLDIEIEAGVVTCEVQGSRPTPYVASLGVRPGDGMPLRRDVTARCSCPDDDNFDGYACKHVVAAMFAFSDELLLEPALLDVWRQRTASGSGTSPDQSTGTDQSPPPDQAPRDGQNRDGQNRGQSGRRRGHLTLVSDRSGDEAARQPDEPPTPLGDPLAHLLASPPGTSLPALPDLPPIDPAAPPRPALAAVIRDALGHVRVEWD